MPGSSPALLGMPDIETLSVLTINDKTIGRQLVSGDNADKRQRNCQCERAIQREVESLRAMHTIGRMLTCKNNTMQPTQLSCTNRRQHVDAQEPYNIGNVNEPIVDPNAMVMGRIKT